ncbi:MAG: hypothetical protein UR25_C0003G0103 [Candidatus Nomurabacteria bacterium GW2011_GWE1_32_28]|uniref:Uncharacterized protein n=1 Tax=Candidatus Nomurabacteria bacterium GW2011_GWF1_31_48 TaxID=1618767 RepID=A0A0G0AUI3_9BACT|nr:MAG: hypothetical protein UR10_C0003G0103 [Candidatus Nomurabacteria bacterium GW2011_GWF2_30_133]KKP28743.1 MAG: hypothetical protein UR18_C0002G0155 [Candidatus Nomurabacteria bacterium GW2011_GWE2_31_40]KKP30320.1 MAG: hypothetical protein UR19_C0003G0156 [Candidatus Nomurabacteria bacterium GW2011_GWF1_31_48]KKP34847.1 MAG: hypothetical protein UR25_C0003G0103 [Candidatus Nomurabacteria bacterium GW2011_GWE1_32_28]HAS80695.1 hypothetical protein [Candidatus Nomurabacteria bacterium]
MKILENHKKYILPILNIITLCIIIFSISLVIIHRSNFVVGVILIILSFLSLSSLILFKIKMKNIEPDILFGLIDNGILVILSIFGGKIAGVSGAVIGGVVGNAITDGIAGMFEGYWAENLRSKNISEERMVLGSAVGKMSGCLLAGGVILVIASFF